ncbi:hypothetical protein PR048_011964 [Dryococelus australis]|uniref:Uncharacterized protein n=1 Tax=Dryococelus australis TaxID=614101 RepID=A0ABQ9HN03_9NEOP|nr:hypothetical protein PR048_011964 [Dryococelus australis]
MTFSHLHLPVRKDRFCNAKPQFRARIHAGQSRCFSKLAVLCSSEAVDCLEEPIRRHDREESLRFSAFYYNIQEHENQIF